MGSIVWYTLSQPAKTFKPIRPPDFKGHTNCFHVTAAFQWHGPLVKLRWSHVSSRDQINTLLQLWYALQSRMWVWPGQRPQFLAYHWTEWYWPPRIRIGVVAWIARIALKTTGPRFNFYFNCWRPHQEKYWQLSRETGMCLTSSLETWHAIEDLGWAHPTSRNTSGSSWIASLN